MRGPRRIFSSGGRDRRPAGPPQQPTTLADAAALAGEPPPRTLAGIGHVTVYATPQNPAELTGRLLRSISTLATGDAFCAADPDTPDDVYSATISDTIATFVIDIAQNPIDGELPPVLRDAPDGDRGSLTEYGISVAGSGPGADRLRYRLAKAVLDLTGGVLTSADGSAIEVGSLADPTWGALW